MTDSVREKKIVSVERLAMINAPGEQSTIFAAKFFKKVNIPQNKAFILN
jgi:hypothetical protein